MDMQALTTEFERVRPQLKSYVLRMTAHASETEDIVQDTLSFFCL